MSYGSNIWVLTEAEEMAGLRSLLNSHHGRDCWCIMCDGVDWDLKEKNELRASEKYKEAAKYISNLTDNKKIKEILVEKVYRQGLGLAIERYMRKEDLPHYYLPVIKSPTCIETVVGGIFYKVCRVSRCESLSREITSLATSLRKNHERRIAYERVGDIQKFIHSNVDKLLGVGAARQIPVQPIKNALSACRLHLNISDIKKLNIGYISHIEKLSMDAAMLEKEKPRPPTPPWGKLAYPKWRVRHLWPISHYYTSRNVRTLKLLFNLDESLALEEFRYEAIKAYVSEK